jgi:hypothetical protein
MTTLCTFRKRRRRLMTSYTDGGGGGIADDGALMAEAPSQKHEDPEATRPSLVQTVLLGSVDRIERLLVELVIRLWLRRHRSRMDWNTKLPSASG